jgi:flagellar FliJ protein
MDRRFRLAGLLRLRTLQEEQAAATLAVANAATARARDDRDAADSYLAGHAFPTYADPAMWQASLAARVSLAGLVEEAGATLAVAERRAEIATADWSAARTQVATVDKLAERHAAAVQAEDERAEQLHLDEVAGRRWTKEDR